VDNRDDVVAYEEVQQPEAGTTCGAGLSLLPRKRLRGTRSPAADLPCGEGFEVYARLCRVEDSDHLFLPTGHFSSSQLVRSRSSPVGSITFDRSEPSDDGSTISFADGPFEVRRASGTSNVALIVMSGVPSYV